MKFYNKLTWPIIIIIILTVIGLIIRLINLGNLTLWVDEYIHALPAKEWAIGKDLKPMEGNGILLTHSIYLFFKIFGVSDFSARLPSVLFGVGSIPLIYILAKKLYNNFVGVISALLLSFSLYHIFWSRIARNYAIFLFFFLIMNILFLYVFDSKPIKSKISFFKKIKIPPLYLALFVISIGLSFSAHPLTFLSLFGMATYFIIYFFWRSLFGKNKYYFDKYAISAYLSIIGLVLVFVPLFAPVLRSILLNFVPENGVNNVMPNWERINLLFETKKLDSFNVYYEVIKNDYTKLFILGFIGIPLGFFLKKGKNHLFVVSNFIFISLLMSFIFRDPTLPRYYLVVYGYFIMLIAVSIWFIYEKLLKKIAPKPLINSKIFHLAGIILIIWLSPLKKSYKMVSNKNHGRLVTKSLSHWYFTNWKEVSVKIKNAAKPNDKIITTGVNSLKYYVGLDTYHYRQKYYNGSLKKYLPVKPDSTKTYHANSLQGIQKILADNDRVWLVVDYYFDNVFSDPAAKAYLIKMMEYKPEYSNNDIRVFLYDKSKPKKTYNSLVEVLHTGKRRSLEYFMNVNQIGSNPQLIVETEGLNFTNELKILVNKQYYAIPNAVTGSLYKQTKNPALRQVFSIGIPKDKLKVGRNSIIFEYIDKVANEQIDGITIYNIQLRP